MGEVDCPCPTRNDAHADERLDHIEGLHDNEDDDKIETTKKR